MEEQRLSFGFTIPQRGIFFGIANWSQMLAMAREVDRIDLFDSIWVGDSLMAKPRPESISLLGALSAATARVKLGSDAWRVSRSAILSCSLHNGPLLI